VGYDQPGARVIVAPDDTAAVQIASARLPLPTLTPVPEESPADQAKSGLVSVALTGQATDGVEAAAGATPRVLNPLERARAAKIRTAAEAIAKSKAAKASTELSAVKAAQANKTIAGLRTAELALAAAQNRLDAATKALDTVKTPEAAERAKVAVAAAEAALAAAGKASEEARAQEAAVTPDALAAARAAWEAENASGITAGEAKPPSTARTRSRFSSARRPTASTSARPGLRSTRRR
jgi:hypothetical protein